MIPIIIVVAVLVALLLVFIFAGVKIIPQTKVYVVERLGSFNKLLKNGVNFIIPFIDRVILKESLKERVMDFPAQDVITKDNVTMKIDTVVYMQITDAKLYAYGVEKPIFAIENLTATTLRNLIGELELDQTLTSRDSVNEKLRVILDEATDAWGIKVMRVELKNILPPIDIRKAMEKQMRAEREKRQQILIAEGNKTSAILIAEGKKAAAILNAEGVKQSINLINSSKPSVEAIKIKSFQALVEVSKGSSTTILLPTELTDVSKLTATIGTVLNKTIKAKKKKESLTELISEVSNK